MPADFDVLGAVVNLVLATAGAAAGAYYGASGAYRLESKTKAQEKRDAQAAAIWRAAFALTRQFNEMAKIKKQVLNPDREKPGRHLKMRPAPLIERNDYRVDLDQLTFLLTTPHANTLQTIDVENDWFQRAVYWLNERNRLHREFQTRFETILGPNRTSAPVDEIEKAIGAKMTAELRQATDSVFEFVDHVVERHPQITQRFSQDAKALFPEHTFPYAKLIPGYFEAPAPA